jgi:crossover junction endodeoxyribonuclease RusA
MKTITLTVPYPISANRYWATRTVTPKGKRPMAMTYVTPEAKAYKATGRGHLPRRRNPQATAGRVQLDVQLYPHRPLDWQSAPAQARRGLG